jgi:nucleoside-diphosphate-sugar epimerase
VSNLKRVLITGKNSYVGTNVEKWLMKEPDKYYVESISVRGEEWKTFDFSTFDVVLHVAGIAHVSAKKNMKDLYFKVNRDLAVKVAKKAKESCVSQFIFMSSMIVYNSRETIITKETVPNPDNFYGESKLLAENLLLKLESNGFKVSIIRPPMIYGPESKGNFSKLVKISKKLILFPKVENKRSSIYIDNFCEFIKKIINSGLSEIYFPQNNDYFNITEIILLIANSINRKIFLFEINHKLLNTIKKIKLFNKILGSFYYDKELSNLLDLDYNVVSLKNGMMRSISANK